MGKSMDEAHDAGLEALYTLHHAELLRFLTSRTGERAEAEEILQDLWIRIQSTSIGPVGNGRAYLYRMAQNLVLDRLRAQKRRAERDRGWSDAHYGAIPAGTEVVDDRLNAEEEMAAREETARIASALATLPEGAARVFRLHKIDGLNHGEVAAQLGITRSGVEKHMAVAMKYLRAALRTEGNE